MVALAEPRPLIERRYTPPPLPLRARLMGPPTPPSSVAGDVACALDPARLCRCVGFTPDAWQAAFLRSQARQVLLLCARQVGKSTAAAVLGPTAYNRYAPQLAALTAPQPAAARPVLNVTNNVTNTFPGAVVDNEQRLRALSEQIASVTEERVVGGLLDAWDERGRGGFVYGRPS
jgi:hypothetical protein